MSQKGEKPETKKRRNNGLASKNFMHQNVSFAIVLAQFFGIMPLYGVTKNKIKEVHFRWISFRFFYSAWNITSTFFIVVICFAKIFVSGFMVDKSTVVAFYTLNFFGMLQFVHIARYWNEMMNEWVSVEIVMRDYPFPVNLKSRFKLIFCVVMILAFFEHVFFILNNLVTSRLCENVHKFPVEIYFGTAFQAIFTVIEYAHWKAVLIEICNILCTFAWNFTDAFIILISSGLAMRFRQIAEKLETNVTTKINFWREIREDYNRLAILCRVVDKHVGPLVVISFINNLYFLCIQLYNSLKPRSGISESVYFFYSFGFLLGRTIAVSSFAASINDESRRPLEYLHSVHSEYYDIEVNRLISQIYTLPVGISGAKYFLVTRSFLLKVFGTIITFELMLMQFGPLVHGQERVYSQNVCIR